MFEKRAVSEIQVGLLDFLLGTVEVTIDQALFPEFAPGVGILLEYLCGNGIGFVRIDTYGSLLAFL